jgi:cholesterol transport system auxiliary component
VKAWSILLLLSVLAGCVSPGEREAASYYVLQADGEPPKAQGARQAALLVAPTVAADFYDSAQLVFSREPDTRGYYQLNRWTERPSRRIHALLVERLAASGAFRTVAGTASGVHGDLVLGTQLEELYHQAASRPGSVRITLTATLSDPARRAILARRTFTRTAPAASYDAKGAVAGINQALGELLNDVVAWVDATAP